MFGIETLAAIVGQLIAKFVIDIVNWYLVRALGQLTILTRASYYALLFVPILAAVWPAIPSAVNRYNKMASFRLAKIESAIAEIETLRDENLELYDTLIREFTALSEHVGPEVMRGAFLPDAWVLAFFAALSAVLGNLIYQVWAPELIKEYRPVDFENAELERYRTNPTDAQLREAEAAVFRAESSTDIHLLPFQGSGLKERWEEVNSSLRNRIEVRHDAEIQRIEYEYIATGAKIRYAEASSARKFLSILSSLFYLTSIAIIIYIIYTQTLSVLVAAGWISEGVGVTYLWERLWEALRQVFSTNALTSSH